MPKPFNPPAESFKLQNTRKISNLPNPRNLLNGVTNNIMGDSDYSYNLNISTTNKSPKNEEIVI